MRDDTIHFPDLGSKSGVCVADGYGIRVRVRRAHLVVSDGIGRERRERVFSRATAGIRRLVIIGTAGSVTFEAVRWMADVGISYVHLDVDGTILAASAGNGCDDPGLRRGQALARDSASGVEVARSVLGAKLKGQAEVLERFTDAGDAKAQLKQAVEAAASAESLEQILFAESAGAGAYWAAWTDVSLRLAKQDLKRLPSHWATFGQRHSPLANGPRLAANPANAILNYLYAIAEAETRIACLKVGLDPGIGIWHTDQKARDSLALDLMEAVRPKVDQFVLDLLSSRTFRATDFVETRKGACRIVAPLTHVLAETAVSWGTAAAPVAESAAKTLGKGQRTVTGHRPTPLTQANRSAGREGLRRKERQPTATRSPRVPRTCATCGGPVPTTDRLYCDDCLATRRDEISATLGTRGPAALARLRAAGCNPSADPAAKEKLSASIRLRRREELAWDAEHERPDPSCFEPVLAAIRHASLAAMMRATGLSRNHCSMIKRGRRVPHPRHWDALEDSAAVLGAAAGIRQQQVIGGLSGAPPSVRQHRERVAEGEPYDHGAQDAQ